MNGNNLGSESLNMDFLVVGGGVIGLSSALDLARTGAKVAVLDRGVCGGESSWAGGGILLPLLPWDYPEPVTRLTQWSAAHYPAWVDGIAALSGIDPEYIQSGMLVLPDYDEIAADEWCASHQVRLEKKRAHDIAGALAWDAVSLWLPEVAQVRNPRLVKALRCALEREGVRVVEQAEVTGVCFAGNAVSRLETSAGPFSASHYVIAAGAWSKPLLGEYAPPLELKPVCGQMLLFKAGPGLLRQIVIQSGFYLIPRADGHILAGSTLEDVGFAKRITVEARLELHAKAASLLPPLKNLAPVRHWAGLRPGSPENIPVIARHPEIENLYLNSGHFRYGVTMAPASAHILANLIFQRMQPFDVSPYNWPAMHLNY